MLNTATGQSARDRLLAVAERLFLESGYDKVSVRAINTAAGMNPAAVHYHFGSKDAMVAALLERRMAPVWQDRLTELVEREQQGWTPTVGELVDVVLTPLAELTADPIGKLHVQLLARFVLGRSELEWTSRWFSLEPWVGLLRAVRPELSAREAARRWILAFDLILQSFGAPLTDAGSSGTAHVDTVRAFVTAGLDAP